MTRNTQSAILGRLRFHPDDMGWVYCQSTYHHDALLRLAGVPRPSPLQWYLVPVKRDRWYRLVLDGDRSAVSVAPPEVACRPDGVGGERRPSAAEAVALLSGEESMMDEVATVMEIEIYEGLRVRLEVTALEDASLPSPLEVTNYRPRSATAAEIRAAAAAIYMHRDEHFSALLADDSEMQTTAA